MPFWLPLTLACALSLATSDLFTKRAIARGNDRYAITWLRLAFPLPILWGFALAAPFPDIRPGFYSTACVALPLEAIAFVLYVKAISVSPLSLTLPFLALTPVFLLFVPNLILGEAVTTGGATGIVLIAIGGYILNLGSLRDGLLGPLRAIAREPGSRYMIVVAFLYSITGTLGKKGILASSTFFFGAVYFTALTALLAPLAFRNGWRRVRDAATAGAPAGLFAAGELGTHLIVMTLAPVAYVIAVKRLSLIAGVIYGRYVFGERGFRERFAGTALMVAGVAVIALRG